MRTATANILLLGLAVLGVIGLSLHVVDVREQVLVLRMGHLLRVETQAGPHWNLPLVDTVRGVDMRTASLDVAPGAPLRTADGQEVTAGAWLAWRVVDPARYWAVFAAEPAQAGAWLTQAATAQLVRLAAAESQATLQAGGAASALASARQQMDHAAALKGLAVIDLRLRRVGLSAAEETAVEQRMAATDAHQAADLRAAAAAEVLSINADTQHKVAALQATAATQARVTAADGVRQAAAIRAAAWAKSPAFYRYWCGLRILRQGLQDGHGVVVLQQGSPLLKFLPSSTGG